MNLFGLQLDLFGATKQEEAPRKPLVSADFSESSLVTFKYSSHLKKSVRCSRSAFFGKPELTLPEFMRDNSFARSREIIAEWAEHVMHRKTAKNKAVCKELLDRFWQSVEQTLADKGEKSLSMRGRLPPIVTKGDVHDLNEVFAAVNSTYFNDSLTARITWSNRVGGLSFHTVRKDPFTGDDFHLISISRGYDKENCPLYAIAGVVYHECLHIMIPPEEHNGRRVVHGKLFRQHERRYIYYDEWIKWHKEVLPLNIRKMRKK